MKIEREFNMIRAKRIEVDEPTIVTCNAGKLGVTVRFMASCAAEGISMRMTRDEARKLAQRLIEATE